MTSKKILFHAASAAVANAPTSRRACAWFALGFDAAHNVYTDLFEAGIVDAAKVVRVALENAVSVASVLLLTEATMTERPEPPKAATYEPGD